MITLNVDKKELVAIYYLLCKAYGGCVFDDGYFCARNVDLIFNELEYNFIEQLKNKITDIIYNEMRGKEDE